MVTPLAFGALALTAILGTFVLYKLNEPAVTATVTFLDRVRWAVGLIFLGLAGYHLLQSGNPVYIFAALLVLAFLTGYMLVERPWKETI